MHHLRKRTHTAAAAPLYAWSQREVVADPPPRLLLCVVSGSVAVMKSRKNNLMRYNTNFIQVEVANINGQQSKTGKGQQF